MRLYHGSTTRVEHPEIRLGRKNLDFGQGFYMTDIKQQAIDWAMRPINNGKTQYLNSYELDLECLINSAYKYRKFERYDEAWLDFVLANRRGKPLDDKYDIVEGGIANDRIFNTIELYHAGLITRQETLSRLIYEAPNNQICVLNQRVIDEHLMFVGAEILN